MGKKKKVITFTIDPADVKVRKRFAPGVRVDGNDKAYHRHPRHKATKQDMISTED